MNPIPDVLNTGSGGFGSRIPGLPPASWARDIAVILERLLANAAFLTEDMFPLLEDQEVLDVINKFLINIYNDSRTGGTGALSGFSEMLEYLKKTTRGAEILGTFSFYVLLSIYIFLFSSPGMAVQAPEKLDPKLSRDTGLLGALAILPERRKRKVISWLQKAQFKSDSFVWDAVLPTTATYISRIQEQRKAQWEKLQKQAEKKK